MSASMYWDARKWDGDKRSWLGVLEFQETAWRSRIALEAPPDRSGTEAEIQYLLDLANSERAPHLTDIQAQVNAPWKYYFAILSEVAKKPVSDATHPYTFRLMHMLAHVSSSLMHHYKHHFKRNRPSSFDTRVSTAIAVPGHPSYPSGHSTQAHLVSLGLADFVPEARESLLALARDIAVNRERAGLHYPSDTEAGRSLARQAFAILRTCPIYLTTLDDALMEWP